MKKSTFFSFLTLFTISANAQAQEAVFSASAGPVRASVYVKNINYANSDSTLTIAYTERESSSPKLCFYSTPRKVDALLIVKDPGKENKIYRLPLSPSCYEDYRTPGLPKSASLSLSSKESPELWNSLFPAGDSARAFSLELAFHFEGDAWDSNFGANYQLALRRDAEAERYLNLPAELYGRGDRVAASVRWQRDAAGRIIQKLSLHYSDGASAAPVNFRFCDRGATRKVAVLFYAPEGRVWRRELAVTCYSTQKHQLASLELNDAEDPELWDSIFPKLAGSGDRQYALEFALQTEDGHWDNLDGQNHRLELKSVR